MRIGKILGYVVGGVIVLVALLLMAVWLLVNPNRYKDRIITAVKDATGRELVLQGDIKLSVFPWIALELGPASLGNPQGFDAQPFVSFRHAAVRAKLLPLLRDRLETARVDIDGLNLSLLKNAAGKGNWQGFGGSDKSSAAKTTSGNGNPLAALGAIHISNSRVSYQTFVIENLNFETGSLADGALPVSLRFDANRGIPNEHASVDAKLTLSSQADTQRYSVAALTLSSKLSVPGNERSVVCDLSSPSLIADLDAQTLSVPTFTLTAAGAQLNGALEGNKIIDDLSLGGTVTLAPLIVREFLPRLGFASPISRDPHALSSIAGSTAYAYGGNALRLNKVRVTLDDTHLQGEMAVTNIDTRALAFNLGVDKIDVDRYLPPEGEGSKEAREAGREDRREARDARGARGDAPTADAKPAAASRPLDANGTLSVGSLHVSGLDLSNLKLTVATRDRVLHVFPLTAQVYGGVYSGDITLDQRGAVALVSMNEHLTGIDMQRLLASSGKNIHLSGKGNVAVKATGRGIALDPLLRSLNGHIDAFVNDGAVEGIDLGYQIARAESLIRREAAPAGADTNRTKFDAFKMSAEITNGVAQTRDLNISSAVIRVTGQGSTNLASKAIDFQLLADTLRSAGGVPIQIPVKITGTTADPTIRPDIEALAKGQLRQKLQDVLQDKLKGLFGKP